MTRLLAWWDGHVPDAATRFRLSFVESLAAGGPLAPAEASTAWGDATTGARRAIALAPVPSDTNVARQLAAGGLVRAGWRELREHRRAVAGSHWRLLLDLVRALDRERNADRAARPETIAIRVTALAELAPVAQHAGHLRHALSLANDVSLRAAALAGAQRVTLLATRPVEPRPPTARVALRLDKRRRIAEETREGWWRGEPFLAMPIEASAAGDAA